MKVRWKPLFLVGFLSGAVRAAPPPENQPVHRNMPDVENARDRGAGRIVDPQTHELDRLDDNRREFEQLQDERDRQLRIEQQQLKQQGGTAGAVKSVPAPPATEPSIVNDIYLSDMGQFVAHVDRQLARAKQQHDRAVQMAVETFDVALRNAAREPDAKKSEALRSDAERQYTDAKARIESNFYNQRMRILGWPTTQPAPATAPTTQP